MSQCPSCGGDCEGFDEASSQHGCAECGIGGGHALYCVRCAEKFVGGYKENVPVHASELLTQVSTDTQYAGNGTAGIQNETKPTGFFFQMPPQRKPLTDEQILHFVDTHVGAPSMAYPLDNSDWINFARAIEAAHGIKE